MQVVIAPNRTWVRYSLSEDQLSLVRTDYFGGDLAEATDDEALFLLEAGVILLDAPAVDQPQFAHEEGQ